MLDHHAPCLVSQHTPQLGSPPRFAHGLVKALEKLPPEHALELLAYVAGKSKRERIRIGVLFGNFARKIDGDSWFTW